MEQSNAYMGEDGLDGQADFVLITQSLTMYSFQAMRLHAPRLRTNRSQDQYLDG